MPFASARPRLAAALAAVLATAAGAALAAPAAAQSPPGAVAYFRPTPDNDFFAGIATVVIRTDAALPLDVHGQPRAVVRFAGRSGRLLAVSRDLHCYAVEIQVQRRGTRRARAGRVGDGVAVTVGRGGSVLDRRVVVQRMTPELARGASLGCTADPAATAIVFNMYPTPLAQPGRFFFTANSGPYVKDLAWTGWGQPTATATGTYVSDCASCGPRQEYAVTVTVDRLVDCPPYGAKVYNRLRFERAGGPAPGDPRRRRISGEADVYC